MTTLPDPSRPFLPWAWPSLRLKRAIDLVLVLGTLPLWGLTIFALALLVGVLRKTQHKSIPTCRGNHGERNARVARARVQNRVPR